MSHEYDCCIAEELHREPRSDAYKIGMRQALSSLHQRRSLQHPTIGTAEYDAFEAGMERGRALYEKIKPIY